MFATMGGLRGGVSLILAQTVLTIQAGGWVGGRGAIEVHSLGTPFGAHCFGLMYERIIQVSCYRHCPSPSGSDLSKKGVRVTSEMVCPLKSSPIVILVPLYPP